MYDAPTHVRILTGQDELTGGEVVPGFRMPLGICSSTLPPRSLRHRKTASRREGRMSRALLQRHWYGQRGSRYGGKAWKSLNCSAMSWSWGPAMPP